MENENFDGKNDYLSESASNDPKYKVFMKWLIDNGTILDSRIQYPTAFGSRGYIGVSASESINSY